MLMARQEVIISYHKSSDGELSPMVSNVILKLTGNVNFKIEVERLGTTKEYLTDFDKKVVKARNGTSQDIAEKNASKKQLCDFIRNIAIDVNLQANGDSLKLQSTGFTLAKERKRVGVLDKPKNFKVKGGANQGDFLLEVDVNKNATIYNFYAAPVPAPANINEWRVIPSTSHKKNISGFTPGKEYELKCAYQGSEETLLYSDSIRAFAH
jgi:hypothetical protein